MSRRLLPLVKVRLFTKPPYVAGPHPWADKFVPRHLSDGFGQFGLAAWLIDHGDGWGQPAATMTSALAGRTINGHSAGDLTREDILDDITLYWLTNTGVSSGRIYWENKLNLYAAADISIPAAVTVFPGENYEAPRSWAERAYHKLIYYNRVDKGGHYPAWEQPQLFSQEVRAAFKSLRA